MSGMRRVLLANCRDIPDGQPWDGSLVQELAKRGIDAACVPWDDATTDWAAADAVVLRITWDYTERLPEFLAWLDRIESEGAHVWNPPGIVRWNCRKTYLRDFAVRGLPVVETEWIERGARTSLARLMERRGWTEAVVKPSVSAGARNSKRIRIADAATEQSWMDALAAKQDLLVQPFLPEVVAEGEWAFVFFAGQFSHALLKTPKGGDWRVQPRHGGSARIVRPTPAQVAEAARFLAVAPRALYARVDVVRRRGRFELMEIELIEPHLYLDSVPGAAGRFADAIAARLA